MNPDCNPGGDSEGFGCAARSQATEEEKDGNFDKPCAEDKEDLYGQDELSLGLEQGDVDIPYMYSAVIFVCSYEESAVKRNDNRAKSYSMG